MLGVGWVPVGSGVQSSDQPTNLLTDQAGTYVITSVINWRKPIILRGEGKDKTRLRFPKSLTDL
jgi:hypothetical protein